MVTRASAYHRRAIQESDCELSETAVAAYSPSRTEQARGFHSNR
jgi:hypothetical protein